MLVRSRETHNDLVNAELVGFVPVERLEPLPEPPAPPRPPRRPPPKSEEPVPVRWRPALAELVRRLVVGDYAGLIADGIWTEIPGHDGWLAESIGTYPGELVELPEEGWDWSPYEDRSEWEPGWSYVDLWTTEHQPSDLTMEAAINEDGDQLQVQLLNVHVM